MERTCQAVTGVHGNRPEIVASHTVSGQELVGSEEACRSGTLHQSDRKVAANAVAGQREPRVRRLHGEPLLPWIGAMQRAVVHDQEFLGNDASRLELGIDPVQLSQELIFELLIASLLDERVRVQLDHRAAVRGRPLSRTFLEAFQDRDIVQRTEAGCAEESWPMVSNEPI